MGYKDKPFPVKKRHQPEKYTHQKFDEWIAKNDALEKVTPSNILQAGVHTIVTMTNALITTVDGRNPSFVTRVSCVSTC